MRKVISLMHVSLDGFAAGPNGELEWAIANDDMYTNLHPLLEKVDTAIYGRVTYGMMEGYWPTVPGNPESTPNEVQHAEWVNDVEKIVVSRNLESAAWNNTWILRDNLAEEIAALKAKEGGNIMIFGSPLLVHKFIELDLIDEYRININPILLGNGTPMFKDVQTMTTLKLVWSETFDTGVIGTLYERV